LIEIIEKIFYRKNNIYSITDILNNLEKDFEKIEINFISIKKKKH
jgi:hypothetical protein